MHQRKSIINIEKLESGLQYCRDLIDAGNLFVHNTKESPYNLVFSIDNKDSDINKLFPAQLDPLFSTIRVDLIQSQEKWEPSLKQAFITI